jgi:glutamine synthetase
MVAEQLSQFADILENAEDFNATLQTLIVDTLKAHQRVIFNGDGYSDEWVAEAEQRGLLNLRTAVDALPHFIDEKNIELFTKHKIYTAVEMHSRYEILLENYAKTINIEGLTTVEMASKNIIPACMAYSKTLAEGIQVKKNLGIAINTEAEEALVLKISDLTSQLYLKTEELRKALTRKNFEDGLERATYYRDVIVNGMNEVRDLADALEPMIDEAYWPMPNYIDLLYRI